MPSPSDPQMRGRSRRIAFDASVITRVRPRHHMHFSHFFAWMDGWNQVTKACEWSWNRITRLDCMLRFVDIWHVPAPFQFVIVWSFTRVVESSYQKVKAQLSCRPTQSFFWRYRTNYLNTTNIFSPLPSWWFCLFLSLKFGKMTTDWSTFFLKWIETTQCDVYVTGVLFCYIDVMLVIAVVGAKLADKHYSTIQKKIKFPKMMAGRWHFFGWQVADAMFQFGVLSNRFGGKPERQKSSKIIGTLKVPQCHPRSEKWWGFGWCRGFL